MPGAKSPISLKARALRWVSQREHSTVEMRRKLLGAVRRQAVPVDSTGARSGAGRRSGHESDAASEVRDGDGDGSGGSERSALSRSPEALAEVEAVIAWLSANDFLSDQRFVESRLHARESGQGYSRIRRELAEHGLDLPEAAVAALRQTELDRAFALCQRRFGDAPVASPSDDARRYRFLMRRGFSSDVIVRAMRDIKRAA